MAWGIELRLPEGRQEFKQENTGSALSFHVFLGMEEKSKANGQMLLFAEYDKLHISTTAWTQGSVRVLPLRFSKTNFETT